MGEPKRGELRRYKIDVPSETTSNGNWMTAKMRKHNKHKSDI